MSARLRAAVPWRWRPWAGMASAASKNNPGTGTSMATGLLLEQQPVRLACPLHHDARLA